VKINRESSVSSWCHAEDFWQESVSSEHKRGKSDNILWQQSLENGRKIIGVHK
jgi:hypothetical protein